MALCGWIAIIPTRTAPVNSRLTISSPELLAPFAGLNSKKSWPEQVKPFNFLLVGHVAPLGHPPGVAPQRFHLVAPYTADAREWTRPAWTDVYSGKKFRTTTGDALLWDDRTARV